MNCTRGAKQLINSMNKSKRSNMNPGFTAIFAKKATLTHCFDNFLGHHTIMSHAKIALKCNKTGKITKL